ncbi:MAG TPA: proline dehydrogenase family protein [Chloroflexota bacterium]|nr:proline dehydrogenase family protein [Chloroflexota bacterium]
MRNLVLGVAGEPHIHDFIARGPGRNLARRFVAGETLDEALVAAEELAANGKRVSLDYLGEAVANWAEAEHAAEVYRQTIDRLKERQISASLSLKPTQFGLKLAPERCADLLEGVVRAARAVPVGVRLDMEDASCTEATLELWEELSRREAPVGVVLQAALYRTPADLERVIEGGGSVRLCKGAYAEPARIAYPAKSDVDAAYADLLERLLAYAATTPVPTPGQLPRAAIATHDERLIRLATRLIYTHNLDARKYEFQMLYGVRRDLQEKLIGQGYPLRVYTPWGPSWYPYLTRRLAERPANLVFFGSSLLAELTSRKRNHFRTTPTRTTPQIPSNPV